MKIQNHLLIIILLSLFFCNNGCKKAEEEKSIVQLPVITTMPVSDVTRSGAIFSLLISFNNDKKFDIGRVKFCFSEKPNPTVNDSVTYGNTINDSISKSPQVSLEFNKTYHVRACVFLANESIIYGNDVTFETKNPAIKFNQDLTYGTLVDIDGNIYKTIQIGSKTWMAENLKVTHFNNGDIIPNITDISYWQNLSVPAYCYYGNDSTNNEIYGKLYNGYATIDFRKIAPIGWHIPTKYELEELMHFEIQGLNESGNLHWDYSKPSNNYTGFTAIPGGGLASYTADFCCIGVNFGLWSSKEYNDPIMESQLYFFYISYGCPSCESSMRVTTTFKNAGKSIRCVKD